MHLTFLHKAAAPSEWGESCPFGARGGDAKAEMGWWGGQHASRDCIPGIERQTLREAG
jgi:hypothetical protein